MRPTGRLVEQFTITLPDGTTLQGFLHQTDRRRGRRILVRDEGGKLLHDTDDAFNSANALASLDDWLAREYGLVGQE